MFAPIISMYSLLISSIVEPPVFCMFIVNYTVNIMHINIWLQYKKQKEYYCNHQTGIWINVKTLRTLIESLLMLYDFVWNGISMDEIMSNSCIWICSVKSRIDTNNPKSSRKVKRNRKPLLNMLSKVHSLLF